MELSLLSKRGVPEDAIISIRSGAVRRQGAISADKPFRFPQNVSESDCVVKVDIMQNIGSGYFVMRPNQSEGKQYEVVFGDGSDISCELDVKPMDGGGAPAVESAEDAAAAAKGKQDAKAYLESTGLLPFVQGVLQVVAKQQPKDPFAAMAKHFLIASDEAVPPAPGSPKVAPASPKKALQAPASPKAEEAAPEGEAEAAPPALGEAAPEGEGEAKAAPPVLGETEAAPVLGETAPPLDRAESEHSAGGKSDNLEELTQTVKGEVPVAEEDLKEVPPDDTAIQEAVESSSPVVKEHEEEAKVATSEEKEAAKEAEKEAEEPVGAGKEEAAEEKKEGAE